MPKEGLPSAEWRRRLRQFAAGKFSFSVGQHPGKGTFWAQEVKKIKACPRHNKASNVDLFGNPLKCVCGYHVQLSSGNPDLVPPVSSSSSVHDPAEGLVSGDTCQPGESTTESEGSGGVKKLLEKATPIPMSSLPTGSLSRFRKRHLDIGVRSSLPPMKESGQKAKIPPGICPTQPTPRLPPPPLRTVVVTSDSSSFKLAKCTTSSVTAETATRAVHSSPARASETTSAESPASDIQPSDDAPGLSQDPSAVAHQGFQGPCLTPSVHSPGIPQKHDFSQRLPLGWSKNIRLEEDRCWIGHRLFAKKSVMVSQLKSWWHPPSPSTSPGAKPTPGQYFTRRLFLWMPRRMYAINFTCPRCKDAPRSLRSKGIYKHVRSVLDIRDFYYLAAEHMECKFCKGSFIAWDNTMMKQVPDGVREEFPAILTHKYTCDRAVVSLLRARTYGNSPTALRNNLQELHSEEWLRRKLSYLSQCQLHRRGLQLQQLPPVEYEEPPTFERLPQPAWFLATYVRDVWTRLPSIQASATSVFGSVLKIDSTKKVCKKLQGEAAKTSSWATNVGNEKGQVVVSVLTTSEDTESLQPMADGLVARYARAGVEPPHVLYTDRDCCSGDGSSKVKALFKPWTDLEVRLDIWHFMRRIARGVTTESHPLYSVLMSQLSACIFEWDDDDYNLLLFAKRSQLKQKGISGVTDTAVRKAVTREEMARHCRRRTRGTRDTTDLIESLLLRLANATDTLGNPLLSDEMDSIWKNEKRHVACIQDPPNVPLYTQTGVLKKGVASLPVYRCARGSTSLENFHLHLARFIPGSSAGDLNFQAFLLDGLMRWNAMRDRESLESSGSNLRTFDLDLQARVERLCSRLGMQPTLPNYQAPATYTGELFGVEYLYHQNGEALSQDEEKVDCLIDEGFEDIGDELDITDIEPLADGDENPLTIPPVEDTSSSEDTGSEEEASTPVEGDISAIDWRGIPGWDKVDALAKALLELTGLSISESQGTDLINLYKKLPDHDKQPLVFKTRPRKPPRGRFARSKGRGNYQGVDAVKRCFLSAGMPAHSPSLSRVVEAIMIHLCHRHPVPQRVIGADGHRRQTSRWKLILRDYNEVKARLLNSAPLIEGTKLALYHVNQSTLLHWYKNETRRNEVALLLQGLSLPQQSLCAQDPLLPAKAKAKGHDSIAGPSYEVPEPQDTRGKAKIRGKTKSVLPSSSISVPPASPGSDHEGDTAVSVPLESAQVLPQVPLSRTTEWRRRKEERKVLTAEIGPSIKVRKVYSCRVCAEPMTAAGHTQFRGKRFCPNAPGQTLTKEEWLEQRRMEATAAKLQKMQESKEGD